MRQTLLRSTAAAALALGLSASGISHAQAPAADGAPYQSTSAQPQTAAPTGSAAQNVRIRGGQHSNFGRIVLHFGDIPAHSLRTSDGKIELVVSGQHGLDLSGFRPPAEVSSVETRQEGNDTVITLKLNCDCSAESGNHQGMLYVDVRRLTAATPPQAAASGPTTSPAQAVAPPAGKRTPAAREADPARRRVVQDAVQRGIITQDQANAILQPPAQAPARRPNQRDDLESIRADVAARIARLNQAAETAQRPREERPEQARTVRAEPPPAPPAPARPACPAVVDLNAWVGNEPFTEGLVRRRNAAARSQEGINEVADLAEFLAGHNLAAEALEALGAWQDETPTANMERRLALVRDLSRLLRGENIDQSSPLLADPANCSREDLALWRAVVAALARDSASAAKEAQAARAALRNVPDRLRFALTLRIADALGDDLEALRAMSAALRNVDARLSEETAGRYLLLARIAKLESNLADEIMFLTRAAAEARSTAGLQAKARLMAIEAGRPGPAGRRAETWLTDVARTYRYDALGEDAAVLLAERLTDRGENAAALATLDEVTSATGRRSGESRAAQLAARILRRILVEQPPTTADDAADRTTLFWRYEGYATPGERGDDIRLGALELLLSQGFGDAALDLSRQLTQATANSPKGVVLRATAEAVSGRGDPQRAIALVRGSTQSPEAKRTASLALARLGRHADAAAELNGLTSLQDRQRRANLLYVAKAWGPAVAAYTDLLNDPALTADARAEVTARYAIAAAQAPREGRTAPPPADLFAARGTGPSSMLAVALSPPISSGATAPPVSSLRTAIDRAKRIETLLEP